jgi:hypothetical protein
LKTTEDRAISKKPANINQNVPTSNIVPKSDTFEDTENIVDSKTAKTTPPPENKHHDLGIVICPSENLAMAQNITAKRSPETSSKPLEVSTGIFVKGKKKTGSNVMTKKSDRNVSLSKIFIFIP